MVLRTDPPVYLSCPNTKKKKSLLSFYRIGQNKAIEESRVERKEKERRESGKKAKVNKESQQASKREAVRRINEKVKKLRPVRDDTIDLF